MVAPRALSAYDDEKTDSIKGLRTLGSTCQQGLYSNCNTIEPFSKKRNKTGPNTPLRLRHLCRAHGTRGEESQQNIFLPKSCKTCNSMSALRTSIDMRTPEQRVGGHVWDLPLPVHLVAARGRIRRNGHNITKNGSTSTSTIAIPHFLERIQLMNVKDGTILGTERFSTLSSVCNATDQRCRYAHASLP